MSKERWMRAKSIAAYVGAMISLVGWLVAVNTAAPAFQLLLPNNPILGLSLVSLPALAVGFLWMGNQANPQLTALQQKRLAEKTDVANEQALLKITALENKIKTLETALSKALTTHD
jgi:hypothetical protein